MIKKLASYRLAISLLLLVFVAQQGNGVLVNSWGNAGSVAKDLRLGTDIEYSSLTELGDNFIGDDWSLIGSGQKSLRNIVNAGTNAQEVILSNSGRANIQGSTATDSLAMGSTLSGQTVGETNIIVGSETKNNQIIVSATGEEIGMDLKSASGNSASIIGAVSVDQEECLDEETSSYVSSGALGFSANGQQLTSDGNLKDFGLVAINHEKGLVENGGIITPGTYYNYDDPSSWVPLLSYDPNDLYALDGAIWSKRNVPLSFNSKGMPNTVTKDATKQAILSAANKWDDASSENLLADNIADSTKLAGKRDGVNVHQFARLSGSSTVAMASLWFDTKNTLSGSDGKPYYTMLESDVRYNTALSWTNDISDQNLYHVTNIPYTEGKAITAGKKFLVESAALHETGHTLGLGDTYLDPIKKYDLAQIMTYYTDPQIKLGLGDISGITALYGIKAPNIA
jgi:hypothetical protein